VQTCLAGKKDMSRNDYVQVVQADKDYLNYSIPFSIQMLKIIDPTLKKKQHI